MAAHHAPPSLGFSRQEHWSGSPSSELSSSSRAGLPPHTPGQSEPPFCLARVRLSSLKFSVSTSTSSRRPHCLASKMYALMLSICWSSSSSSMGSAPSCPPSLSSSKGLVQGASSKGFPGTGGDAGVRVYFSCGLGASPCSHCCVVSPCAFSSRVAKLLTWWPTPQTARKQKLPTSRHTTSFLSHLLIKASYKPDPDSTWIQSLSHV